MAKMHWDPPPQHDFREVFEGDGLGADALHFCLDGADNLGIRPVSRRS
jgi:hypothetical protein